MEMRVEVLSSLAAQNMDRREYKVSYLEDFE